ncbi:hypothetical protein ES705_28377 [subsurface metagenome]
MTEKHKFGGNWTKEKLERVEKYLKAYATIMNKQNFRFAYIDAFAGTGYREEKDSKIHDQISLFRQNEIKEIETYSKGSARIALEIKPEFDKYIFIEKSKKTFTKLLKLKEEFKDKEKKIDLINTDANNWIIDRCNNYKWQNNRAVLFLDPYGMQVNWETIKAIANTKAIDLWYLFPLGIAENPLLLRNSKNNPLYLLCFASGNPRGAKTAIKIAQDILKR